MYMTDREKRTATIITGTGLALATVVVLLWGMVGRGAPEPGSAGGSALTTAAPSLSSDGGTTAGPAPTLVGTPGGAGGGAPAGGPGSGSDGQGGSGQGGSGQDGGGQGSGTGGQSDDGNDLPDPPDPAPEDCPGYDPSALFILDAGASGWQLSTAGHVIALLDTKSDAMEALKVARRWTHSCYIGRGNDRANRDRYIVRYWTGPSGLPLGLAPLGSCSPYDPTALAVKKLSNLGWQLFSGDQILLLLDTEADALRAKLVAAGRHALCFIGRDNTRPDHYRYLFEYWTG